MEHKIAEAFKQKDWQEIKANDSWMVFKIISEFVEGFEKLGKIGPCVSIFGSARTKPDSPYYQLAHDIAQKLTQKGFGVITGGGPGIMEASNKGAKAGGGKSVGLVINLPFEKGGNEYIDSDKIISFDFFFARKVMFEKYSQGYIVLPGGFGTLDELFASLTLIQTGKIGKFPIVLVGKSFWSGLSDWIEATMKHEFKTISAHDTELFSIVDSADEAADFIENFYKKYVISPNF